MGALLSKSGCAGSFRSDSCVGPIKNPTGQSGQAALVGRPRAFGRAGAQRRLYTLISLEFERRLVAERKEVLRARDIQTEGTNR
jgi:hypothetical protein